jgi:DNA topoisomerase VI subunit B
MEMATELLGKTGKPAYVEFSQVAKHLPIQSEKEGRYVAIDVDIVTVRQIGSADSAIFEVDRWHKQNQAEVKGGRLPREHADYYERAYKSWKAGQELPLEGTPIKGWPVIAPSQCEAIIRAGIRTVEDLAQMNGEAMQRIGMGAVMLKNKALAWVAQAKDKGPLTMQMAELQKQNDLLKMNLENLTEQMAALQTEKPRSQTVYQPIEEPQLGIGLSDILDPEPSKRSHHRKEA